MGDTLKGLQGPNIVAAGRLVMAHGGAPAWSGAHPGFSSTIVDSAAGDETVALAAPPAGFVGTLDLTAATYIVLATAETATLGVSVTRATATTLRVVAQTHAAVLTDATVDIVILVI